MTMSIKYLSSVMRAENIFKKGILSMAMISLLGITKGILFKNARMVKAVDNKCRQNSL
ncbi:hypothetical protein OG21DRAFT_1066938 [Imleria badia]|nr:hypothetical protein OG21DRAFT_1066938 [Imleria badia]